MKNKLILLGLMFITIFVNGQTTTENYVQSTTYQVETTDGVNKVSGGALSVDDKIENVTYYDGLGRAIQQVSPRAGGNKETIYTHIEYDGLGRQSKNYLPISSSSELTVNNHSNILADPNPDPFSTWNIHNIINDFYLAKNPSDQLNSNLINAFSETVFEASPLNRALEQGAPGADWRIKPGLDDAHTIKFEYTSNDIDEVPLYNVIFPTGNTEAPSLYYDEFYQENELYKTITKDENWKPTQTHLKDHTTEEFKDKQGRVILKRTYNNDAPHDTHYVYDDFGNLTYVMSPKGSDLLLVQNQYTAFDDNLLEDDKFGTIEIANSSYNNQNPSVRAKLDTNANTLDISFNVAFSSQSAVLNTGAVLALPHHVPDIVLGTITAINGSYTVSVIDGFIHFSGSGNLSGIYETFIVNLPEYSPDPNILNSLCYQYHYDYRNRLIEKKIPGKDWEYIVYDKLDRLVLTQDAYLRADREWLFTKYDAFNRVVLTGILKDLETEEIDRESMQQYVGANPIVNESSSTTENDIKGYPFYYTNNALQLGVATQLWDLYTVNYYDDYNPQLTSVAINPTTVLGQSTTTNTKSLPTGSRVKVMDGTNSHWVTSVSYYDDKARPIYAASHNSYLATTDILESQLDFTGKVLQTKSYHTKGSQKTIGVVDNFSYDHTNRLLTHKQNLNSLELINLIGIEKKGNIIEKTDPSDGWHNQFASMETLVGDGYASWQVNQSDSQTIIGFSNQENGIGYGKIQYGLYAYQGYLVIYEGDGVSVSSSVFFGNVNNNGLFNKGDELSIHRDNGIISYKRNGEVFYTSQTQNFNNFIIDGAIRKSGSSVSNLLMFSNEQELISLNEYDELGQLVTKGVGGIEASPLQSVDYSYNIRGWLKGVNNLSNLSNDLFGFRLNYNTPTSSNSDPLYNGNISEVDWKSQNDNNLYRYNYNYDALNRLEKADFSGSNVWARFKVFGMLYDKNGNMSRLKRYGHTVANPVISSASHYGMMDNLIYTYEGNQLTKVEDLASDFGFKDGINTGDDYTYDTNGNMTQDKNKDINSISYNHLNLPTGIGVTNQGNISYIYDAVGTKLEKIVNENSDITSTMYAGSYIYEETSLGEELKFFSHPEGYIEPDTNGGYNYIYQYKDHLGNIRLSYSDSDGNGSVNTAEIIEENNYYPFGMRHKGYNNVVNGVDYPYGFNGMEENDELGLEWLDFDARNYDASLGRWMNLDPLAEMMRRHSPYNFAFNNPLRFIDPDGMAPEDIIILEGDKGFREQALADLQQLTDNKLEIDENGKVTEAECQGSSCSEGTGLISELINSDKTVTISQSGTGNSTEAKDLEAGQTPGKGSDSVIGYNPNNDTGGEDVNGNTKRNPEVGLAHELGHAREFANGTDTGKTTTTDYILPYGDDPSNVGDTNTYKVLDNNEVKIRKLENKIRQEQNHPLRVWKRRKQFKWYGKY